MFQLTAEEVKRSRSHFATLNSWRGKNIKYPPFAFTEHGAIQVANVLNSPRAIAMGVHVRATDCGPFPNIATRVIGRVVRCNIPNVRQSRRGNLKLPTNRV
jgi:hypothetical protein